MKHESDSVSFMSKTFRPWDIEQRWLLPPSVDELVPAGHVAHFVRETVREELDLSAILSAYSEERGYPPYHPAMMVALLLYAYSRGVYSSRRIAQTCEERVDFMAVTALNKPDFRTIATFRQRHLKTLGDLFVQVLKLCRAAGLVKLGHVSLDGTKVQANASRHKAMSYGRMREAEKKLAAEARRGLHGRRQPTRRKTANTAPNGAATRCPTGWPTRWLGLHVFVPPKRRWKPKPRRRRLMTMGRARRRG